jgi:hypothetical protein
VVDVQLGDLSRGDVFGLCDFALRLVLGLVGLGALAGEAGLGRVSFHTVVLAERVVIARPVLPGSRVGPLVVIVLLGTVPLHLESVPGAARLEYTPLPLCVHRRSD